MNNKRYWQEEGSHRCLVVDCETGQYDNAAKQKYMKFVLQNSDKQICRKSFVLTEKSVAAIRTFAAACGVKLKKGQLPGRDDLIGRSIEIDVVINDEGYPVAERWRRPTMQEKEERSDDVETLF